MFDKPIILNIDTCFYGRVINEKAKTLNNKTNNK